MGRPRYETRCGGRLLKVIQQVELPELSKRRDDWDYADTEHWWVIDDQRVEPDVADAMLAKYGDKR